MCLFATAMSHMSLTTNPLPTPLGGVKTSVSVRYGTGFIFLFLPDLIKTFEKRLRHSMLACWLDTKRAKWKWDLWCGQVTLSVYLLAVNSSDFPSFPFLFFFSICETDTAMDE